MELRDADVIADEHLEKYRHECDVIYERLVIVHNNLLLLRRIEEFPFSLFTNPLERTFWWLTKRAFLDAIIVNMWVLVSDGDNFSLKVFRNRIIRTYKRKDISPSVNTFVLDELNKVDFNKRSKLILEKIRGIRNNFVAHMSYEVHMNPNNPSVRVLVVNLTELEDVLQIAQELFEALYFGIQPLWDMHEYIPRPNDPSYIADIDKLLSFVASRSMYLGKPKTASARVRQEARINKLADEQRQVLEEWRRKASLIGLELFD